ncbi:MAG TPA: class I SAM-dependent methyltransferase [Parvibaculum sp.]|jgi:predicted O-methyltransferase YrrM
MSIKRRIKDVSNYFDWVLAFFALFTLPLVYVVSRARSRTPASRGLYDRIGVSLIPHHYYGPIVLDKDLLAPLSEPRALPGIDMRIGRQLELLSGLRYGSELNAFPMAKKGNAYAFQNPNYGIGDSEILYSLIRKLAPRRIIEIGSGESTLMARAAIAKNKCENPAYDCDHICIEPYEQPWLEGAGVKVIRKRVEQCGLEMFRALETGDMLFIDSSHVLRPQGDVVREYLQILPNLNPGVYVHVHDIFTPRDYPEQWVLKERRLWNEQYVLEALLTGSARFDIVLALNHLACDYPSAFAQACPVWGALRDRYPSAFWLQSVN